jgi:hypothetical protein
MMSFALNASMEITGTTTNNFEWEKITCGFSPTRIYHYAGKTLYI